VRHWLSTGPLFWIFWLAITLVGCSDSDRRQETIKLGINLWPGYAPLNLAQEIGARYSDRFELVDLASTRELLRGLAIGTLDGGGVTLPELLNARDLGIDLVVVIITNTSSGADAIIAKPTFNSIADLKGHRIGCDPTTLCSLMISRAAETVQLTPEDFITLPVLPAQHESAFSSNEVDALVTFEPALTRLTELGGKIIFSSADIPNEIIDVLVVKRSVIESNPDILVQLSAMWSHATQYLSDNPEAALGLIDKRLKMGTKNLKEAFNGISIPTEKQTQILLSQRGAALHPTMARIEEIMLQLGVISSSGSMDDFFLADTPSLKH